MILIVDAPSIRDRTRNLFAKSRDLTDLLLLRLAYKAKMLVAPTDIVVFEMEATRSPFSRPHRLQMAVIDALAGASDHPSEYVVLSADPIVQALSAYTKVYAPTPNYLDIEPVSFNALKRRTGYDPRDIRYFADLNITEPDRKDKTRAGKERPTYWAWAEPISGATVSDHHALVRDARNLHIKLGLTGFQNYEIVQDIPSVLSLLDHVPVVGWDTETTGIDRRTDKIVGESLSVDGERGYYVPIMHVEGEFHNVPEAEWAERVRPVIASKRIRGANLRFDVSMASKSGLGFPRQLEDIQCLAYMLGLHTPNPSRLGLKSLSKEIVGDTMEEFTDVLGKADHFGHVPIERGAPYAADDAVKSYRIAEVLGKRLTTEQTERLESIEIPFLYAVTRMEHNGLYMDMDAWEPLKAEIYLEWQLARDMIWSLAGEEFSIGSRQQLSRVLYDKLGLPVRRRTKSGQRSTDHATLELLEDEHPIIPHIIKYRETDKLLTTYMEPYPEARDSNGRIHSSLNPYIVITGRLASTGPNILNIPVRTELGRKVRKAFTGQGDNMLGSGDASQLEYRILAHATQNPTLIETFWDDSRDIHKEMASIIYGVPPEEITQEQRDKAKTTFYAIVYGAQERKVAATLNAPRREGARVLRAISERIPEIPKLREAVLAEAWSKGYVETEKHHRTYLPRISARTKGDREHAERAAFDALFQGTGSGDVTKIATFVVQDKLDEMFPDPFNPDVKLVVQAHDELLLEGPEEALREVGPYVSEAFANAVQLRVPIKAEFHIGKRWGDIH